MFIATIVDRAPGRVKSNRLTVEVLDANMKAVAEFAVEAHTLEDAEVTILEYLRTLTQKWQDKDADALFIGKRFAIGDGKS